MSKGRSLNNGTDDPLCIGPNAELPMIWRLLMNDGKVGEAIGVAASAGRRQHRIRFRVYIAAFSLLLLGLGIGLTACSGESPASSPAASSPGVSGPLGIATVGRPAPGFSLTDQYGRSYTLTPGDGKNHVLVFFMGNF